MILSPFSRGFLKRVQNDIAPASLWSKGDSLIIGVSGGPDSVCLLDLLFLLSKKYDFKLHVAHVNYGLRGKDSLLDEQLVRKLSDTYDLPCSILHVKKIQSTNIEERLRDIRYRFFEKLRAQKGCSAIAVAHNRDDQAETFLMRLLRGSGGSGLSSMLPKNGFIIRPLLSISREEILRYIKERSLRYRIDKTNLGTDFLRNRLRHSLIPNIEKEYQPNIKAILADTAELLAADSAFIENFASRISLLKEKNGISFSLPALLSDSPALANHSLRFILRPFFGGKNPSMGLVREIIKALKSAKSKHQIIEAGGLKLTRKGDTVTLLKLAK